ncbi:MAG: hypothetical protein CMA25_07595 [Euryarchaeota archaeon]|nr:hypothetical protein [Euryarchaeota archaeon]
MWPRWKNVAKKMTKVKDDLSALSKTMSEKSDEPKPRIIGITSPYQYSFAMPLSDTEVSGESLLILEFVFNLG